jgi:hypothetical protein
MDMLQTQHLPFLGSQKRTQNKLHFERKKCKLKRKNGMEGSGSRSQEKNELVTRVGGERRVLGAWGWGSGVEGQGPEKQVPTAGCQVAGAEKERSNIIDETKRECL